MSDKIIKRFLSKIGNGDNGCWSWKGTVNIKHKYAIFGISSGKPVRANRFSYELFKGEIPKGLFVCHTCDNRQCVNPDHLFLGTNKENIVDMMLKGRHPNQKLRTEYIPIIRDAINAGFRQWEIAKYFGVTQSRIAMIKNGTSWAYSM